MDDPRKWLQIYDRLLTQILDGSLSQWDKCPPTGDTAKEWGVARQTAAKAYRNLAEDGYLRLFPGTVGYLAVREVAA